MPDVNSDLDWLRRRMVARELGLLDEADETRFADLVVGSAACRRAWEEFQAAAPELSDAEGHIPAGMIARWDRVEPRLQGTVRELVERHLETCAECREDLRVAGFAGEATDPTAKAGPAGTPLRLVQDDPDGKTAGRTAAWWRRPTGLWATTATAVAAVLAVLVLLPSEQREGEALPYVIPAATRGVGSPPLVVSAADKGAVLAVSVPVRDPRMTEAEVWVLDSAGRIVLHVPVHGARLEKDTVTVVWSFATRPPEGEYRALVLPAGVDPGNPEVAAEGIPFRVVHR